MNTLTIAALIVGFGSLAWASNPRGDDLKVEDVECQTHDFELWPQLKARAIKARENIIKEGRFGVTRTNPDGIIVTLKVENDTLWVTGIGISGGDGGYAVKPSVIPTDIISKPIIADWFSGELTGYYGRLLSFHVREFGYIFDVSHGRITSKKEVRFTTDKAEDVGLKGLQP